MSVLSFDQLGCSFGAVDIFRGLSGQVAAGSKIGLIGPNGIGKTSLLLMLAGLSQPSSGTVSLARGRRLGYLRQEAVDAFADRANSLYAEMLTVFSELRQQQERLHEMELRLEAGEYSQELLERYGNAQAAFEQAGGYDYEVRIQRTLQGLGFERAQWQQPLNQLSGGQKTRALLARLLLEQPDLLILDEPTNHLDVDAVEWLENILRDWPGALLVVSHDRYFLDRVVTTIWEMNRGGLEAYTGSYSAYLMQRDERWERSVQVFAEEKARLLKDVDFIQRNIARASTNARAVGLLRRLSRDLAVVENFGLPALRSGKQWHEYELNVAPMGVVDALRQINALQPPSDRPARPKMRLRAERVSGNLVLRARRLEVGYPTRPLFALPELELRRGECAALIGPNGSGKTTFLKTLLGQLQPLGGQVSLGAGLQVGYFAQAHDSLVAQNSVLDELLRHKEMLLSQARSHLAHYLFRGEDVFKPVSALSGGERGRLALAILALDGANFLLLDEPTNHLDVPAQEALQEVLEEFPGTILLVSHDRYLVDRLATQVWELRAGQMQIFKGDYRAFVAQRERSEKARPGDPQPARKATADRAVSGGLWQAK